jgi:hypothetical protein
MSKLLKARLGGKKFIEGMNETLKKLSAQASKGQYKSKSHSIEFNFNQTEIS